MVSRVGRMSLAVAVAGALVAGCGGGSKSDAGAASGQAAGKKTVTVGVLVPSTTNEYWNAMLYGAKQQAKRTPGVKLLVQASRDDNNVSDMIAKIQDLQTRGAQALAIAPYLPDPAKPVLQRLVDDGIPVVCMDSCVTDWTNYASFIQTDNLKAGRLAGDHLHELVGEKGKVGMLQCFIGAPSCDARIEGAKQQLPPGIKVVGPLETQCLRDKAVKATQDLLTANPDIKALYAVCGQAALAAETVLRGAGRADIPVIGVDGVSEELDAIESGKQDSTVAQFPIRMGEIGVEMAVKAARGESVTKEIDSGEQLITKDMVAAFKAKYGVPGS